MRTPTNACELPINAAVFGFSSLFRRASAMRVSSHCIPLMDAGRETRTLRRHFGAMCRVDTPGALDYM
jgi:hypothetical protein